MKRLILVLSLIAGLPVAVPAQVPGTDLYRLRIVDGVVDTSSGVQNLTARQGYDNQPAFTRDGSGLLYTSIGASGQADIHLLDLATLRSRALTTTATSEYSPTPIPGSNRFSIVMVEPDSTQRLWSLAPDGSAPRLLLEDRPGVGYHCWGDSTDLLLFVLGSPHELHRVRRGQAGSVRVAVDVGRCLQRIPGEDAWSFTRREGAAALMICRLDRESGAVTEIAPTPDPSIEDYCWSPDGQLWSSDGTALLVWDGSTRWRRLLDLRSDGIEGISRMSFSPDGEWLVFVATDRVPRNH